MSTWNSIFFMDAGSPFMEQMMLFHDHTMIVLLFILIFVLYILTLSCLNSFSNLSFMKHHTLEIIWSLMPIILLIFIALPSLKILYQMEEIHSPLITVKCYGHQWYWSYEYSNWDYIEMDSYMSELSFNLPFRLLNVDHKIMLPINYDARFLISSADVIHSWTLPAMGVKVDAVPGRINQVFLLPYRYGLFFGQCSEICGANHSFMPISLAVSSFEEFSNWILKS